MSAAGTAHFTRRRTSSTYSPTRRATPARRSIRSSRRATIRAPGSATTRARRRGRFPTSSSRSASARTSSKTCAIRSPSAPSFAGCRARATSRPRRALIFSKARFFGLKSLLGRIPEVGFYHHRWFVEIEGDHVRFRAKDQRLLMSRSWFITRRDLGRKMTEHEPGAFLRDRFTCEERFDVDEAELESFRSRTLAMLRCASVSSRASG